MFLTYSLLNASHDNSLVMYAPRCQNVIFEEKLTKSTEDVMARFDEDQLRSLSTFEFLIT